jgi:hypothetical protein
LASSTPCNTLRSSPAGSVRNSLESNMAMTYRKMRLGVGN